MNQVQFTRVPYFFRLHGSVLPTLIVPLLFIGGWATCVTAISRLVWSLGVNKYPHQPPFSCLTITDDKRPDHGVGLCRRFSTVYSFHHRVRTFYRGQKVDSPFLHFHEELMGVGIGRRSCLRFVIWRVLFGFMWQNVRANKAKRIFSGNCTPLIVASVNPR
jgi:hypothetical protein